MLRTEYTEDAEFLSRFQREAEALLRLPPNPHIVALHEFGEHQGTCYIAMEFLEGHDLQDVIQRQGALPLETALSITAQVAEALEAALKHGIVHRDIKPANIKITPEGIAKIMDFGIARAAEGTRLTRTGLFVGTPSYVAPEIWEGQPATPQSDVYALGIMLYEMLLGRAPFEATTPAATMRRHLTEPPPPLSSVRPDIPRWLAEVAERAIAKNPAQRYRDAGQFLAALRSHGAWPPQVDVRTLAPSTVPAPQASPPSTPTVRPAGPVTPPPPIAPARYPPTPPPLAYPAPRRSDNTLKILLALVGLISLMLVVLIGIAVLGLPDKSLALPIAAARSTDTATPTPPATTPVPPTPTLEPTATPSPTASPTSSPTSTPAPTTPAVLCTPPPCKANELSYCPGNCPGGCGFQCATFTPSPKPTSTPGPTQPPATTRPGTLFDFESTVNWRRGDQPNGTLTQAAGMAHSGQASARLDYNFPTADNDFVVFLNPVSLSGQPNTIGAWVYGDSAGHFFNVWIKDSGGQVWQVPLGRASGPGWQQLVGYIATGQAWPWTHISGPDNGQVDYPIQFYALVLDDMPDTYAGSGTIYVDDITAWRSEARAPTPVAQATAPAGASPAPTVAPLPVGAIGRIVFTSLIEKSYYLYHTDPSTGVTVELGRTDWEHSTCRSNPASTLTGQSISLSRGYRCALTSSFTTCKSPNGKIEVVVSIYEKKPATITFRAAGGQGPETFLYSGELDSQEPLAWSPDGNRFTFVEKNGTVFIARTDGSGYNGLTNGSDVMWSPDGTLILFSRRMGAVRELFVIAPDGSGERNVTNAGLIDKLCPAWRP